MGNFEFLKEKDQYKSFTSACLEAEKSLQISPATTAILSRRALELAVKWTYSFDEGLKLPYDNRLSALIHEQTFRDTIEGRLFPLLRFIVKLGNVAVHTNSTISRMEAITSLRNLHQFVSWIDYCYSIEYTAKDFNEDVLLIGNGSRKRKEEYQDLFEKLSAKDRKLEDIIAENEQLRKKITATRIHNQAEKDYDFKVDEISECETRKRFIDVDLKLAGWSFDKNIQIEYKVTGMPNSKGIGYVDYVLFGDNGKPLAVIEAKRTSFDVNKGKQQAKLYADCIENMHNQRPIIFLTNGFESMIWDDTEYPDRAVSGIYAKPDLEKLMERRQLKRPLQNIAIKEDITNRAYQKEAIINVCEAFGLKQRDALLVMATGSGKTRVSISIVDVLVRHNWVKNVLFLADRTELVRQAKNSFNHLLPSLSLCNLLDDKESAELSRVIFSTYQTMMNAIDGTKRKDGNTFFTPGHFDLIIIDESHRSIYKKYRAIFDYFDSLLVGLTATPKDEIDFNTYEVFGLESGNPTYAYELEQAIEEGYLVDYRSIESVSKFMENGIHYDDLSEEEKQIYEETFDEEETYSDYISGSALNEWLFNNNTVDYVLNELMEKGLKVDGGDRIGKTIVFAKNAKHAKHIVDRFNHLYPHYKGKFCQQVDYSIKYAHSIIDNFKMKDAEPHIAVSVDMLDTGIDVPEVVNLVFFKKVRSKTKFWQMIGRGTRLCEDLFGPGQDKEYFFIFDYVGNFEFFRENPRGIEGNVVVSLTERLFNLKVEIIKDLQSLDYQNEPYMNHRNRLINELLAEIRQLNDENFQVRLNIKYVYQFQNRDVWNALTTNDVSELKGMIAPLIIPNDDDEMAKRFDNVMYTIELAYLTARAATKPIRVVVDTAEKLSEIGTIPSIIENKELLTNVQSTDFWDEASIFELEEVREVMRELVEFLEKETRKTYYTNFRDTFNVIADGTPIYGSNDLKNYQKRVNQYLKEHQDEMAIYKLRHNKPLTKADVGFLQNVLWNELGTREDYEKEFGETTITRLVRQVVGLDRGAVNAAFSEFLSEEKLNATQIKFVRLIIDYVVANGYLEKEVLQQDPFRTLGSVSELFEDNIQDVRRILGVIDDINENVDVFEGA
jgi:type I restriction enzyme R subunit